MALLNFNCLQTSYATIATELLKFILRLSLIIGILIERFFNLLNIIFGKPVVSDPKSKKISLSYFISVYILVPNLGDHRICMSTFILSVLTGANTKIKNFETVFTSSPSFLKIMKYLGVKYEVQR